MVSVGLVHDYLTQRGGAERVVLSLTRAFPDAPLHTSLYEPKLTFPEFGSVDVRPMPINRLPLLRRRHRLALPLLACSFGRLHIDAEVVICSSSGWAHGARTRHRKIVYCHTPARWLYQRERYVRHGSPWWRIAAFTLQPILTEWDRRAASSADAYLANSRVVAERILNIYGISATVVPPPPAVTPDGSIEETKGLEPGFVLCVSRLLSYKNVDAVIDAFREMRGEQLVVVGNGPHEHVLRGLAPPNVQFLGAVNDAKLRWLYDRSFAVVAASHEDYGLTPLEAASFGKPVAVLRWGGFLETVVEGRTGVFFDEPKAHSVAEAIRELRASTWDERELKEHARTFGEPAFVDRIRAIALS